MTSDYQNHALRTVGAKNEIDPDAWEAFELLGVIRRHAEIDPMIPIRVKEAARLRHKKIKQNRTIDDFGITELRTRAHLVKEAYRKYTGELRAFVAASYRHGKTE